MPIAPRRAAALLAVAALGGGLAACGDEETKPSAAEQEIAEPPAAETQPAETQEGKPGAIPAVSKDLSKKPEIPKPAGSPPSELVIKDIVEGKGKA
ncbi:MAG TPA: hypothetical protein VFZ89_17270, partial [Solirubrobacteraceae bacterium]